MWNVWGFIILRAGEVLTFFSEDNAANFRMKEKYNEAFHGVYFFRIREKALSRISSSNLEVSN